MRKVKESQISFPTIAVLLKGFVLHFFPFALSFFFC